MTGHGSAALRQPFLSTLGDITRGTLCRASALRRHQSRPGQNRWPRMGMRGAFGWLRRVSTN